MSLGLLLVIGLEHHSFKAFVSVMLQRVSPNQSLPLPTAVLEKTISLRREKKTRR
jgi:hypothetical protein